MRCSFLSGVVRARPRALCSGCAVRRKCLEYALENKEQFEIWGGTRERSLSMKRNRPHQEDEGGTR